MERKAITGDNGRSKMKERGGVVHLSFLSFLETMNFVPLFLHTKTQANISVSSGNIHAQYIIQTRTTHTEPTYKPTHTHTHTDTYNQSIH